MNRGDIAELKEAHYSVSQIEHAEACYRSWAFSKLEGLEKSTGRGAELGGKGHDHLEAYFKSGKVPNRQEVMGSHALGLIQAIGIPPKHPGLEVEKFFKLEFPFEDDPKKMVILGFMDLFLLSKKGPIVFDHKFVTNLDWAKTAEHLTTEDVQSTLYMFWAMKMTGEASCRFQWNYSTHTGAQKIKIVRGRATLEQVLPRVEKSINTAKRLHKLKKLGVRALDIIPNLSACGDYGGRNCREVCGVTLEDRVKYYAT